MEWIFGDDLVSDTSNGELVIASRVNGDAWAQTDSPAEVTR